MLKALRNRYSIWEDSYHTYQKKITLAKNIKIKNKKLYEELAYSCKQHNNVLTYAEYLTIDQFGKNGFYATSGKHGKTDIHFRWGKALANYCYQNGYTRIIEIGCGTGELGIAISKAYNQLTKQPLKWIGVEIDKNVHEKILGNFKTNKVQDAIESIVSSIDEIPTRKNALIVFPYSLDSMIPQVFLNTQSYTSYPNALLGITVANGTLSEILIPPDTLREKKLKLEKGIFTQNNLSYNLSTWKLRRGQRNYFSSDAYALLYRCSKKFADSCLIIIDEMREEHWNFNLKNLGIPKSLYEKNIICNDRMRYYRESGQHNLYYPLYKVSILKFLSQIGYRSIEYEIEQKKAAELNKSPWFSFRKKYATFAVVAKDFSGNETNILPIPSPQKKIF